MLDGATAWQRFRYITFPMMLPILAIVMTFLDHLHLHRLPAGLRHHPAAGRSIPPISWQRWRSSAASPAGELGEGGGPIAVSMIPFLVFATLFSYFGLARPQMAAGERAMTEGRRTVQKIHQRRQFHGPITMEWDSRARRVVMIYLAANPCFVLILLFPFYWMAITSFKPNAELLNYKEHNPFWITSPTLAHIKHLLFENGVSEMG